MRDLFSANLEDSGKIKPFAANNLGASVNEHTGFPTGTGKIYQIKRTLGRFLSKSFVTGNP
ncbi:hypothetical protein LF95_00550 [Thalassospira sp. TSL5-1]|nr:hypothetical protein LF95_00550 [Thalassospira sp. TSL5-1]